MKHLVFIDIAEDCDGQHRDEWPGLVTEKVSIAIDSFTGFEPKHRAEVES